MGMFRTPSPWDSVALSCSKEVEGRLGYIQFYKKGTGSLNIRDFCAVRKIRYQVKKLSVLCMRGCKPLGSLNSFHSYVPQLSGAKSYFLVHLKDVASGCFLHSLPQSELLKNHHEGGGTCWITVLGILIHIWRPEIIDDCDISCLLLR